MDFTGPVIAFFFIIIVVRLLLKKYNPHAVLLFSGLIMMVISWLLGYEINSLLNLEGLERKMKIGFKSTSGESSSINNFLDFIKYIVFLFQVKHAKVSLLIMTIGGFVAYINKIGASKSLVNLVTQPLNIFKKNPNIAAVLVIPIGQLLFICIPSAAGLGLLLMASVFPVLVNLGVSRLSAVSVITACTALGMGPASAMSNKAAEFAYGDSQMIVTYFYDQIQLVLPISLVFVVVYYFTNRYYDSKETNDNIIIDKDNLKVVSSRQPSEQEMQDLLFAFKVAKHVKSNAIVYAKEGATVGIGAGQMNRLDSSRIAARKSEDAAKAEGLESPLAIGSVVASDAFFPFADGLMAAADAGVTAIIQPGGSIRDDEVIEAANNANLAMVFTGIRHFNH